MEIHFLVMEKSWKIIVEKEWSPWLKIPVLQFLTTSAAGGCTNTATN